MNNQLLTAEKNRKIRLETIIKNLPDNVFLISESGTCVDVYEGKHKTMSYLNYVQFIGANAFDVFQKDLAQKLIYITNKAIQENKTQFITYSVAPEDLLSKEVPLKDTLWYEGRAIPLILEDTQEKIAMWITRDITEKVLL